MAMIEFIKKTLKHLAPELVAAYHQFRSSREMRKYKAKKTPHGFSLSGHGAMQDGAFEPVESDLLIRHFSTADVFVDIGAHIGYFTCLARSHKLRVVSVEPHPNNLKYLYSNILQNGWEDVEVLPIGLSSKPGLASLYGGGTGASFLPRWSGNSEVWKETVPVSTLDSVLGSRFSGKKLVIKIDVEGHEYDVLAGAAQTLDLRPSPVWMVEICLTEHHPDGMNPKFVEIFELFWSRGYTARTVEGQPRIVSKSDVVSWVGQGRKDDKVINYEFQR